MYDSTSYRVESKPESKLMFACGSDSGRCKSWSRSYLTYTINTLVEKFNLRHYCFKIQPTWFVSRIGDIKSRLFSLKYIGY